MKVTYGIGRVRKSIKNAVLVIGVFDGMHFGHKALIRAAMEKANEIDGKVIVMTFDPHPVHVLHPKKYLPLIVSLQYRLNLLCDIGVEECVVVNFNKRFASLDPENFIRRYLVNHIKPKEIFIGDDFRFGHDKAGTLKIFSSLGSKYGFNLNVLRTVEIKEAEVSLASDAKISSTMIRHLIMDGKLNDAATLLGRKVSILGKVVRGDGRGKRLGFATANIDIHHEVIPPLGIYAIDVIIKDKKYKGMANLGICPSFQRQKINLEVHIFGFNKDLYGQDILVEFVKKIRDEKKFDKIEDLIFQMKKDEAFIKKLNV
jgi:riboflavin kinase/FMN adenylyltransferase